MFLALYWYVAFTVAAHNIQQIRIVPGVYQADTQAAREKEPIEQLAAVVGETVNLGKLLTAPDVAKKLEALDQTAKSKTEHVERCVVDLAEALARNAARVRSDGRADVDHTLQTKITHELIPILRSVKAQADD